MCVIRILIGFLYVSYCNSTHSYDKLFVVADPNYNEVSHS